MKVLNFIIFTFLLVGCGPETMRDEGRFLLENRSTFDLKITFRNNVTQEIRAIELADSQIFEGEKFITSNGATFTSQNSTVPATSFGSPGTEVEIVFQNMRKLFYSFDSSEEIIIFSDPVDRNIFRASNYLQIDDEEFLFVLTQEDYNNATPCDGPCE